MENKIMFLIVAILVLYLIFSKKGKEIIKNITGTNTSNINVQTVDPYRSKDPSKDTDITLPNNNTGKEDTRIPGNFA